MLRRVDALREAEGEKQLPQQRTFEELDKLEEEILAAEDGEELDRLYDVLDGMEEEVE